MTKEAYAQWRRLRLATEEARRRILKINRDAGTRAQMYDKLCHAFANRDRSET